MPPYPTKIAKTYAVNHYERLKVSQDAPPEVIRAAYRALAAKLHPDRQQQGVASGPDDVAHGEMAALNAAYEVLIDPKLRTEYDATLLTPARGGRGGGAGMMGGAPGMADAAPADFEPTGASSDFTAGGNGSTRVDMDWIVPKPASSGSLWPPSRRMSILGGGGIALVVLIGATWFWQVAGQHKMERALSAQYTPRPPGEEAPGEPLPQALPEKDIAQAIDRAEERELAAMKRNNESAGVEAPGRHKPTVEELAKMSDEELLRVLPTLDGQGTAPAPQPAPPATARRAGKSAQAIRHPLDGRPLSLRTDTDLKEEKVLKAKP